MITLTYDGTTGTLPPDLFWSDENNWHPVEQVVERTITGALVVHTATRIAGRPITLEPFESGAWMYLSAFNQVKAWAAVAGRVLTLNLRGVDRSVIFRHHDGEPLSAVPLIHYTDVQDTDWYLPTFKFTEL
jgi:hypothetical protein